MKVSRILLFITALNLIASCDRMDKHEQNFWGGTALGTVGGTAIGALSGHAGQGALIGAGAGALGGFLYDRMTTEGPR